jgi:hypothetical protein
MLAAGATLTDWLFLKNAWGLRRGLKQSTEILVLCIKKGYGELLARPSLKLWDEFAQNSWV